MLSCVYVNSHIQLRIVRIENLKSYQGGDLLKILARFYMAIDDQILAIYRDITINDRKNTNGTLQIDTDTMRIDWPLVARSVPLVAGALLQILIWV